MGSSVTKPKKLWKRKKTPKIPRHSEVNRFLFEDVSESASESLPSHSASAISRLDPAVELGKLSNSIQSAIPKVDALSTRIHIGHIQLVDDALKRLWAWLQLLFDSKELSIVFVHLNALRTMLTALKMRDYATEPDITVVYSLFQTSIINFCLAMEMIGRIESGDQLASREMHRLYVPHSIVDVRDNLVHGTRELPGLETLILTVVKCFTWYGKYFWPNLSITNSGEHPNAQKCLTYQMHFPEAEIFKVTVTGQLNWDTHLGERSESEEASSPWIFMEKIQGPDEDGETVISLSTEVTNESGNDEELELTVDGRES